MNKFRVRDIAFALGENLVNLHEKYPEASSLIERTGIGQVFQSDLKIEDLALQPLTEILERNKNINVDCLICVTQSPRFVLPGISNFLQHKSGLPSSTFLMDLNQGCAGFVQALIISSKLLVEWKNIIIVCVDQYRNKLATDDRSTNAVFSDCATATLISSDGDASLSIVANSYIFDGSKTDFLYQSFDSSVNNGKLFMDGPRLWAYTRTEIVPIIKKLLGHSGDVNALYMHQASKVVFEGIAQQLQSYELEIPSNFEKVGNTVSCSIPMLLHDHLEKFNSETSIVAGFGVGINAIVLRIEPSK